MRIAVWHNLPSGGGKRALYEHVRGLIQRGHYVEAWCPPTASQTYLPLSPMIKEHVTPLNEFRERPERYYSARACHYKDTVFALNAMEEHCRTCLDEIEKGSFDVIFANPCLLFRTSPIGRLTNLPSVLYLQEPNRWLFEALPKPLWRLPNSEPAYDSFRLPRGDRSGATSNVYGRHGFRLPKRFEMQRAFPEFW